MNYKIIKTEAEYPDVLLHRDRDDNGNEAVIIKAIGTPENEPENNDHFVQETIEFGDYITAQCFIEDFSQKSAENWCGTHKIMY